MCSLLFVVFMLPVSLTAQRQPYVTVIAGNGTTLGDGGPSNLAKLACPTFTFMDPRGNILIADRDQYRIRQVFLNGTITTIAGTGTAAFCGEGIPATQACLRPTYFARDLEGNLFFTDQTNNLIRKISLDGIVTTLAGGSPSGATDGPALTTARFNNPTAIAMDFEGNFVVSDWINQKIRKIWTNGTVTTIAGTGTGGYTGDGGPAVNAQLNGPYAIAVEDETGDILVADFFNKAVRRIFANGTITTAVGKSGNLGNSYGMAVDPFGNIWVSDTTRDVVLKFLPDGSNQTIVGIANNPSASGVPGPASGASLDNPIGLSFDLFGNLLISDYGNNRVLKVSDVTPFPVCQTCFWSSTKLPDGQSSIHLPQAAPLSLKIFGKFSPTTKYECRLTAPGKFILVSSRVVRWRTEWILCGGWVFKRGKIGALPALGVVSVWDSQNKMPILYSGSEMVPKILVEILQSYSL